MIYFNRMTKFDSIQYLQESSLNYIIIPLVMIAFRDAEEQITFGTKFKNNESTIVEVHDLDQ